MTAGDHCWRRQAAQRRRSAAQRRCNAAQPPRAGGYVLLGVVLTLMMAAAIALQIGRESALSVGGADAQAQTLRARYVAESGLAWAAAQLNASGACSVIAAGSPITGQVGADTFSVSSTTVSTNPLTVTLTSTPRLATAAGATDFAPLARQLVLYTNAEVQTKVDRAYGGSVADTFIAHQITGVASGNAVNVGADPMLVLDNKDFMANVLLRFDLVPAVLRGGRLKKASLVMTPDKPWPKNDQETDITVHEVTSSWPEGSGTTAAPETVSSGATWDQRLPATAWGFVPYRAPANVNGGKGNVIAHGGGDYDPAHVANVYVDTGAIPTTLSWDVTPLAAQWLASPASNLGLLLKAEEDLKEARFHSSEARTRTLRPRLVLTTQLPCGGPAVELSTVDVATGQPVAVATTDTPVLLRITLTNGAAAAAVPSSPMTIALPTGLTVSSPSLATTSGCGAMAFAPASGSTSLTASGGSIAAASGTTPGVCTLSVAVRGSAASGTATLASGPIGDAATITVAAGALATSVGGNASPASTALWIVPQPTLQADTYLDEDLEDNSYGSSASLRLRYDKPQHVMLRFAGMPPSGVTVQSATLRVYLRSVGNPAASTTLRIQPQLISSWWAESTATWDDPGANDKGAKDYLDSPTPPLRALASKAAQWVELDVVAAVDAWAAGTAANYGLLLISATSAAETRDAMVFDSRELAGGNPAQLQVTY